MKPKILVYDIETAPILGYVWKLWDNDLGLNQIKSDWHLLSWAAKWYGEPANKIQYMDQRRVRPIEHDRGILKGLWALLDQADIVITQNGKEFDEKKLNARFILNGLQPPSSYKHVDTRQIAKRKFGFTSNSLEYMSNKLCTKYKKLKHTKFSGFELWTECLADNPSAWREMEKYNKYDVLATEELYSKLQPWDNSINYNLYTANKTLICSCGGTNFSHNGHNYTSIGKFKRYRCKECGAEIRDRQNDLSKEKRSSIKVKL